MIDENKVFLCDINKLIPYEKNTKQHPVAQISRVAHSIKMYGFDQPISVDENFVLIKGHGRLLAAKSLELKEVPVYQHMHLTEQEKMLSRIADNKVAESEWNEDVLWEEMKSLQEEEGLKLNDFGFKAQSAKSLFPDRDLSIFGVVPTNKEEEFEKYQNKGGSRERAEDGEEREDTTVAEMETFVTSFQGKQEYLRKMSVIDYMNTFDKILLGFSGGKDSLANLIFCLEHFPKEKIVPYFSNLGIGVDWTHSAVYIKAMERKYNIKIHNIGTPDIYTQGGFYDDLLQYGYPSPVSCWVRNKIKLPHVKAFQMQYKNRDDNFCVSLAVRWAESENRAKTYPDRGMLKDGNMFFAAPIVSWSETDIVKYLADHDCKLPTAYQHGERSGCICCPSEDKKTTITLRKKYPLLWKQILEFHARGARRTGGKLALPHMKKMVASIKDLELVEQERFCGSFSSLALSPIEFENYIEEEMGGKLPCENYMGIPYDPKFHIFKDDLRNTIPKKSEGIENIFTQSEIGGDNGGK